MLHAVALPARVLRAGEGRRQQDAARPGSARAHRDVADGGGGAVDGSDPAGVDLGHRSGGTKRAFECGATDDTGGRTMIPSADYIRILPELILVVCGMLVMFLEPLFDEHSDRRSLGALAFAGAL